ncbi:Dihydroorotase [Meira miltonrushii]|uniref:dihydroorotase n=1 Tax=Meira miltonrushii TaxID=1280837 RepID=A0A316VA07_9BASI|nr:Dihydroorotase [Meira miltonrushii]PWN33898.1 Dihydroorotase [Meira miltonrushii]
MATKSSPQSIEVHAPVDMHVHVRQGEMASLVVPHVEQGGMTLAYVMPNTVPPLTSVDQCLAYLDELEKYTSSNVELVGTLYLHPSLTREEIAKAAATKHPRSGRRRIMGVKSYPRGVTTNSEGGIESYEAYYEVFDEMQKHDMVLNLHGEVPSNEENNITVMTAEAAFLQHLHSLHARFPNLRIVLEHATTEAAVEAVKKCGETVACTITPHHLELIVDDWAGKPLHFCKPVAKTYNDRKALRKVIAEGHARFFLGSDSAPHPVTSKLPSASTHGSSHAALNCGCAAGVYTSAILLPLCASLLDSFGALDRLSSYVSDNARRFYKFDGLNRKVTLHKVDSSSQDQRAIVPGSYTLDAHAQIKDGEKGKIQVVPFWSGKQLGWIIA